MILVSWNINGLRSYQKKYDLKEFIDQYSIDILNLQETKLVEGWDMKRELHLSEEWNTYENIATSRKGYASVASISNIYLKQLSIDMPNERFQSEGRMLHLQYRFDKKEKMI